MDRETIRHLLFEKLKATDWGQINDLVGGVVTAAFRQQLLPRPGGWNDSGYYDSGYLPAPENLLLQELIWELIIQGILTPGLNTANPILPHLRLTEYGKQCVEAQDVLPHDYGTYLKEVNTITGGVDPKFDLYLEESVQAFLKGLYLSSVVNLGVASESMTDTLIARYRDCLPTEARKSQLDQAMNTARHASKRFDELYRRLETAKPAMPPDLRENLDMVKYLADMIRRERNDVGHPTGRRFERAETLALLIAFPHYLRTVAGLYGWLDPGASPIT